MSVDISDYLFISEYHNLSRNEDRFPKDKISIFICYLKNVFVVLCCLFVWLKLTKGGACFHVFNR